jgi:hypothetical protein
MDCRVKPGNDASWIFLMPQKYTPRFDERWIRHDWRRWVRPDFARWIKPGVDPADLIPGLARERAQQEARRAREEAARAAEDAALAAEIEHERRALAALNEEVKELNADMARWRRRLAEEEAKYSPSQPRVPAGNPRGGQWTNRNGGGQGTVANPSQDTGQGTEASLAQPMGNVGIGDLTGSSEVRDLFHIKPDNVGGDGVQVSGIVIRVCIASGISSWTDDFGNKRYTITYDCAGGQSFKRSYIGNYRGIVLDPFR